MSIRQALKCATDHIVITEDQMRQNVFVTLACHGCDQEFFCQQVKRLVQQQLNLGLKIKIKV